MGAAVGFILAHKAPILQTNILQHTLILKEICHNTKLARCVPLVVEDFHAHWVTLSNTQKYTLCHSPAFPSLHLHRARRREREWGEH